MPNKYVALVNGELAEVAAMDASAGVADAGKLLALDSTGRVSASAMPVGIGAETKTLTASEALAAGNLVNVYDNASTPSMRKADASNGREAHGFVLAAVSNGATGSAYLEGTITGLTGLTAGQKLYLGTGGVLTSTPASTAGHISQRVATALSATEATFEPQRSITLA